MPEKIIIYIDGAARGNPGPAGYGIYATDENKEEIAEAWGYIGEQTNNFAEYVGLIAALELALENGWRKVHVRSDSQLLVRQLTGQYKVKNEVLANFYRRAQVLRSRFLKFTIEHVLRKFNKDADRLANKAIDTQSSEPKSINPVRVSTNESDSSRR